MSPLSLPVVWPVSCIGHEISPLYLRDKKIKPNQIFYEYTNKKSNFGIYFIGFCVKILSDGNKQVN